ncbi:hypothetical protein AC249_AIPGENE14576 [Exaiptasia diaphana]|nr:hypothetical protein AC249_AIPGENE14576 [Exaiptasia diaphana]
MKYQEILTWVLDKHGPAPSYNHFQNDEFGGSSSLLASTFVTERSEHLHFKDKSTTILYAWPNGSDFDF